MNNSKQLLGVALIALGLFLFWPLAYAEYSKISVLRSAIEERDVVLTQRSQVLDSVKKLQQEYDQRSSELATFAAVVPAKKSSAEILSSLEAIAAQTGNTLSDVGLSTPPGISEGQQQLSMMIIGKGSYSALKNMLDAFEKNIPLIDVQSLQMGVDSQTLELTYRIQAVTYYFNATVTK